MCSSGSQSDALEMWSCIDGDGDGDVTKEEFKVWYQGNMKNADGISPSDEQFEKLWKKIDADGDGNLSFGELCGYFGISFGAVQADLAVCKSMTDEELLDSIAMMDRLQVQKDAMLARENEKKASAQTKRTSMGEREGVTVVKRTDKVKEAELLEACSMLDSKDKGIVANLLAEEGVSVRVESATEKTMPLHKLAQNFERSLMMKVLQKTDKSFRLADVNSQDKRGFPPIFYALEGRADRFGALKDDAARLAKYYEDQIPTVLFLLENGADMYVESKENGWNIMHMAAHTGAVDAANAIIEFCKSNKTITNQQIRRLLNHCDQSGRTPLHIASMRADANEPEPVIVKLFLINGADPDIADKGSYTASSLAVKSGRRNSKEYIDNFSEGQKERTRRVSKEVQVAAASE